ncbi:ribonucleoside-diphosphate reductase subunit alpha [Thauera linaloolentis]|uniref:Ribonucleoside-diphosphate reductase n=1 Tax=Thauera linaloolentis (strain DSM 12138 / JCM 21573 / CCUG 41526 / CIP 105981 / IAM 15112 / NBRC 102519 / 47Lol) TaxID=1123367 RepID=N6YPG9_THAL4|nr:ribonucleoside-diphosphate reductase subunit alpha [Thauera linaloolentis]ENO84108.1 ribonucleotide-diphosphate reductase subunit alpha [Thauera linaloolentis 47Lol = DSM 12138]MCM8564334.1 ribonucleoside-diphosphate reductase subunit alpha [Thauera linaloolentis]
MDRHPASIHSIDPQLASFEVIRRNGAVVPFDPSKIAVAMSKAFLAVEGRQGADSSRVRDLVARLTDVAVGALTRRLPDGGMLHIEDIQDQVELALMRSGEHDVARAYVLYRERRAAERAAQKSASLDAPGTAPALHVVDGEQRRPLDRAALLAVCREACDGLVDVSPELVLEHALHNLYDGVPIAAVRQSLVLAARTLIEREPDYSRVAARLLLSAVRVEVLGHEASQADMAGPSAGYEAYFPQAIRRGIDAELLDPRLADFDLERLAAALKPERDLQFDYLGLQTLYDRYFLHVEDKRIELPQTFFMRVAMGLALDEIDREARAIEFYLLLSSFDFMSSTPTLFNSGTRHSQLSSCYLTTVADSLEDIYQSIKENALLQKFAGGLGNDWTPVRALGSRIKGTNGQSQGVIPFLKVVNDTAVAVNQGGKRKGAVCAYLETWHLDIEEFLELRKNTGDERRRTHDMNTANWVPDLFMKRVLDNAEWTLFSPSDVPELHDLYGQAFETAYTAAEARAASGEIRLSKKLPAVQLWRKMLTMLFETGHPWITFKDACNLRSPQQHVGVVHSSNLCTEITLNTSALETAVCNLGSVNLPAHLVRDDDGDGGHTWRLDHDKLQRTVRSAMRLLDNVVDLNYYATPKARTANLRHRPVGMGIMGFADALHLMGLAYASDAAVEFADRAMEQVCHAAYWASTELAEERGRYSSFRGSLWDKGILPQDSLALLAEARGRASEGGALLEVDRSSALDWAPLRERIARHGMRNSNCVAIAPTATISNIVGVSASIEPDYQNLYVKSNLSGEFTVVNAHLVRELKARGLWDPVMASDLKYFDGSLAPIERIPADIKERYATAFEIAPHWLVEAASRRQKWIDQAQSLNLYVAGASGRKLDELYRLAWLRGLKTTYYLRTLGATAMEKTSAGGTAATVQPDAGPAAHYGGGAPKACSILDPDCEACQ